MTAFVQGRPPGGIGVEWLAPLSSELHQAGLNRAVVIVDDLIQTEHTRVLEEMATAMAPFNTRWITTSEHLACPPAQIPESTLVIGVGGGTTMDSAKFFSWLPSGLPASLPPGIVRPRWSAPPNPLMLVPTTLGTGSEVSSPAITWHGRRPSLVHGPAHQTRFFLLEPRLVHTLPASLARAGLFEVWCRLVCASVDGSSPSRFADAEAQRLSRELEQLVTEVGENSPTRDTAMLRGLAIGQESILGWALAGRGDQAFRLWYPAMEWAAVAGASKVQALVDLLPAWAATRSTGATSLMKRCDQMMAMCALDGTGSSMTSDVADAIFTSTTDRWFPDSGTDALADIRSLIDQTVLTSNTLIHQETWS